MCANDRSAMPIDGLTAELRYPPTETWELAARLYDMSVPDLIRRALYKPVTLEVLDKHRGGPDTRVAVRTVPGHRWGGGETGPRSANVMVIGKMPGREEVAAGTNFVGPTGQELRRLLTALKAPYEDFYVTNVLHFLPPDGGKELKAYHIADCATLLMHEIVKVNPKFLLLLGADAVKFVFGRKARLSDVRGAKLPLFPATIGKFPDRGEDRCEALFDACMPMTVMATQHPARVLREPVLVSGLEADLRVFIDMVEGRGSRSMVPMTLNIDYRYIRDADELDALVDDLIAEGRTEFAFDCEWGGSHFMDGWLRTIQFAWDEGKAAVVVLRTAESQRTPVFVPTLYRAVEALRRLIDRPGVHITGQNFRSDALWLEDLGLPVMEHFDFDTMLADHTIDETQEHNLPAMATRYTPLGRYDFALQSWLKKHPQAKDVGYANVPDDILHKYAAGDVDATWRCKRVFEREFAREENAGIRKLFREIVMPVNHPLHEMEMTGIAVDPARMSELFWQYDRRKQELLQDLRGMIRQPTFNPRSFAQKTRLLFGSPEEGGMGLTPVKTTEKPSREWASVMARPTERASVNPSTDAETLELLQQRVSHGSYASRVLEAIQQYQIIDQVTKNFLRPPVGYGNNSADKPDRDLYVDGLMGSIKSDGRIHTSISQIKETGRHGSRRPALHNLSKRMESRYQEIMGRKVPKIRSCFVVDDGYVLVEADYRSEELTILAYLSGDRTLIDDVLSPIKLHARVAVDTFGAPCTYAEVAEKYTYHYMGAKSVNFGIPYQRGARAIARQINRDTHGGARMTYDEAQDLIDKWYARYQNVREHVDWCKWHVRNGRPLRTPWGRTRHFRVVDDEAVMAAQERESIPFTIQGTAADCLNRALTNLWAYKRLHPEYAYKILLAIHDAVLLAVPVPIVEHVVEHVLPLCMIDGVVVPATERSPEFRLDIDTEISFRWGEPPDVESLRAVGVPEKFWPQSRSRKQAGK